MPNQGLWPWIDPTLQRLLPNSGSSMSKGTLAEGLKALWPKVQRHSGRRFNYNSSAPTSLASKKDSLTAAQQAVLYCDAGAESEHGKVVVVVHALIMKHPVKNDKGGC
mmetsp:Transcript_46067/g.107681  ORF Transcript_46067/g.107681 Transcript_46067/m.107681 type:complete len:108 (-) Transcript_46067:1928-2251(-)